MLDENILSVLRNSTDSYISGEELCKSARVSRAAVWKHIEKLRGEGYLIEAIPHLGYRLAGVPDSLIPAEVRWRLKTRVLGREIISYKKTDSTNDIAYGLAESGVKEGAVIIAEEQDRGKGRHGRQWISPAGGIYMSCVLRPKIAPNEISKITLVAAVAVAKAIRDVAGLEAVIKWPNDILIGSRKVCGILTEMKAEQDMTDFVIIGVGVNVNTKQRDLPKGATSLKEELIHANRDLKLSRIELCREMLQRLEEEYLRLKKEGFIHIIEDWKNLTAMIGARVKVALAGRNYEGFAHDIDPDGSFVIRLDSGMLKKVASGDVVMIR